MGVVGKKLCCDRYYVDNVWVVTPEVERLLKRKLLFG